MKIEKKKVEIVLPVYNEEKELETSVVTLLHFLRNHPDFFWKITIVDNASSDKTYAIATQLSKKYQEVSALSLTQKGRGRAVKKAWTQSSADILAYMDIDLSTDLKHLTPMLHALERGYDIGIGSRNAPGARVYGRTLLRTITSKGYMLLMTFFFWVNFSDAQCGFKAITKKASSLLLPHIVDDEWFFDTELLILAEKSGFRIYEEPVTWIDNPGSTVRVLKTAFGDLEGLWRMFTTRPWRGVKK